MSIAENIQRVLEQIEASARRAGRSADSVTLMGVSKTFPAEAIEEAYAAGLRVFGENRVQEFAEKSARLRNLSARISEDARFHLIGHLQSNKANKAAELFGAVDSVDSLKLAEKLNLAAGTLGKKLAVLLEINIGGEAAKNGLAADSNEIEAILEAAARFVNLEIRGLMTVPPFTDDPEGARPYFRQLRELRGRLQARNFASVDLSELSMGMSHDFAVAIEEGSTCVRVGTAIFGKRPLR
jgi:pyridoxal phosphate enzyme (YggS family)